MNNEIIDVQIKELVSFPDDRGFFRELIRATDPFFKHVSHENSFYQWSHSKMTLNTVKAWHFHHQQFDWWYCPLGLINVVLYDLREESPTYRKKMDFFLGDTDQHKEAKSIIVRIPPGVAHGCKVLTDSAHLFYITSEIYDPNDEGRLPFDSDTVPHNWGDPAELIVTERDKKLFIPTKERLKFK
jgi:dTDP-4-dehydrorhamnose 3,5-epimerase